MGRVGVDLYPLQDNVALENVDTFSKSVGGSAGNVAIAAAKYGRRVGLISRTGPDAFGRFVHQALRELNVDDVFLTEVPDLLTPLTFCEMYPPDHFPLLFYRLPIAPDLVIRPEELDLAAIADADIFWTTVTGLSAEPSRSAHHAAWAARDKRPRTILDLDYRPMFCSDPAEASRQVRAALPNVTIAIGNKEECEIAVGETEPMRAAKALLDAGVELAIVKQGPKGVLGMTRDTAVEVLPTPVKVLNGLGAGDGFGGAFCHG
ncbi:MAG: 5-dehydro-2-deoxygluconokinase, partial [Nakamurella sp.]